MQQNKPRSAPAPSEPEIDLREMLLTLWRRKTLIVSVMAIGILSSFIILHFIKPHYTARSLLLIQGNVRGASQSLQALPETVKFDTALIMGEIEILRSRGLAAELVKELNLADDPEFAPRGRRTVHGKGFKSLSVTGTETVDRETATIISRLLNNLSVRQVPGSFAIKIEYTSLHPEKAALIANSLADLYIRQRLDEKFQATRKLTEWLDKRLTDLREQVTTREAAVEEYRAANNLAQGTRGVMSGEQLSEINQQIVMAKTKQAQSKARLEQIKNMADNPKLIDEAPEALDNGMIHALRLETMKLERELSEFSGRYGDKHPEMIKRKQELGEARARLRAEIRKLAGAAEEELNLAAAQVSALEDGMNDMTGQHNQDNEAMIKLRALEREADSTRQILDRFLETYKRSDKQEELADSEVKIISPAARPDSPSYPNNMLVLSLSGVMSLMAALSLAFLLEKLDNSVRSPDQLEQLTGYPCYVLIPQISEKTPEKLGTHLLDNPASSVAEAVRTLRMVLNLKARSNHSPRPKVITMTSSLPDEGKTTISTWLGRLAAGAGERVVLVDCDLRRPSVHAIMGDDSPFTLAEYLTGKNSLRDIVKRDEASGLDVIYARSVPDTALDLLNSERMATLVEELKAHYDLVILDSAACLPVSDARILAALSDQTLYVVAWNKTPEQLVRSGIKQFADMDYQSLAFVMSNVDFKKHVSYGYGHAAYYYGYDKKAA